MKILGIDPGLANTGWSIVEAVGGKFSLIKYGVLKTKANEETSNRIFYISSEIKKIATEYGAVSASAEEIFFTNNISSAISVAKVIGAITYVLLQEGIPLRTFTPTQIKNAVTGVGSADKKQVADMVGVILGTKEKIKPDHVADSVASAITYAVIRANELRIKKGS